MKDEAALLRSYVEEGAESAFTEIVRRHVDLVYGAALRRTNGDAHLAADVTQDVFIALARHARKLSRHSVLSAWLHTATRNAALNRVMADQRRKAREQAAFALLPPSDAAGETRWENLRPVIDAAIDKLPEADRSAVVLRFLEQRSFAELGAVLRVTEDAARMRTARALHKLRDALARRGITSSVAALTTLIETQSAVSAPAGLAAAVGASAWVAAGNSAGAFTGIFLFMNTKIITTAITGLVAFGLGVYFGLKHSAPAPSAAANEVPAVAATTPALEQENLRLKADVARLNNALGKLNVTVAERSPAAPDPTVKPLANHPMMLVDPRLLAYQQQRAMTNNLRQIAGAWSQFRKEHGRLPLSLDEMVGEKKYIRRVQPVDGEDYSKLPLTEGSKLVLTTLDGVTATVDLETGNPEGVVMSPAAELVQELGRQLDPVLKKAAEAYRAANNGAEPRDPKALLPYLASPQETADFNDFLEALKVARVN